MKICLHALSAVAITMNNLAVEKTNESKVDVMAQEAAHGDRENGIT